MIQFRILNRLTFWCFVTVLLFSGCSDNRSRKPDGSVPTSITPGSPQRPPDITTDAAPVAAPSSVTEAALKLLYRDKPLFYWVEQSQMDSPEPGRKEVVEALLEAYADEDHEEANVAAIDALQKMESDAYLLRRLSESLGHSCAPWVRMGLIDALWTRGGNAVPVLQNTAQNTEDRGLLFNGNIWTLGMIGAEAESTLTWLNEIVADENETEATRDFVKGIVKQIRDDITLKARQKTAEEPKPPIETPATLRIPKDDASTDWPQFHGPRRDNLCRETGLLQTWPEGGPAKLWTCQGLGIGFSNIAIVGDRLFTMGDLPSGAGEGEKEEDIGRQCVLAFDLKTREALWSKEIAPAHTGAWPGPRCTPTIDGERLYALGTEGELVCLKTENGDVVWQGNLADQFDGKVMKIWKYSESPLVDGERLIVTPGGPEAMMVALNKNTGETVWQCATPDLGSRGDDGAGYCSVVIAEIEGVKQYIQFIGRGLIGVEAASGRFLWGYNRVANAVANITMPVVKDNHIFVANSYSTGSALLELTRDADGEFQLEEKYFLRPRQFDNQHGGILLLDGYIFGGNGQSRGNPTCIDMATGRVLWTQRAPQNGSASVTYADGRIIWRYDRGLVLLTEATPSDWKVVGKFRQTRHDDGPMWTHPVIHNGRLYLRHNDLLECYDVTGR